MLTGWQHTPEPFNSTWHSWNNTTSPKLVVTLLLQSGKYMNLWERSDARAIKQIADIWNYNHHIDFVDELKLMPVPGRVIAHKSHLPFDTPATFELAAYRALAMEMIESKTSASLWSSFPMAARVG